MEWADVLKIIAAALASIGGGGALVIVMSSFIGKLWASRFLEKERHKLGVGLEKTKRELDLVKETTLRFQNEKLSAYRAVIDAVAELLASLDIHEMGRLTTEEAHQRFDDFNEKRIKVYGYLAILAPQGVMDAQDRLMDYLLEVVSGRKQYKWETVRNLAISLLNEIRIDIGIDKRPIKYNGVL